MSFQSSRKDIGQALTSLVAAIIDPVTSQPIYSLTSLGAVFNPSNNAAWCEVTHFTGQSNVAGSGGDQIGWRVEDNIQFLLTSGIGPYESGSTAAQTSMLHIMDIVLPVLHSHFELPLSSNPLLPVSSVYSVLPTQTDRSHVVRFPDGHTYLMWVLPVIVKQQYSVALLAP